MYCLYCTCRLEVYFSHTSSQVPSEGCRTKVCPICNIGPRLHVCLRRFILQFLCSQSHILCYEILAIRVGTKLNSRPNLKVSNIEQQFCVQVAPFSLIRLQPFQNPLLRLCQLLFLTQVSPQEVEVIREVSLVVVL